MLKYIDEFAGAGIEMNCQLVMCRGVNDGGHLRKSLEKLGGLYPAVRSIAAVPTGLTRYRDGLYPLEPYDRESACAVLDILEEYGEKYKRQYGVRVVYPGDEWFLLAGRPIPPDEYYDDYVQLENGVGMWRLLHDEFMNALPDQKHTLLPRAIDVATGTLAYPLIRMLADTLQSLHRNVKVTVHCIRNDFFRRERQRCGPHHRHRPDRTAEREAAQPYAGHPRGDAAGGEGQIPGRRYRQAAGKGVGRARAHPAAERRGAAESPAEVRKLRKPDTKKKGRPMGKPIVAIVGRPNVGKSTLFNKLVGQRLAIVEDTPGVTRDRLYGNCEWRDHRFLLIDTGGIEPKADDVLLRHMRGQAQLAIDTADAILFVTDIRSGVTAQDQDIAAMLMRSGKPVFLVVNKVDGVGEPPMELYDFYSLGIGEPYPVSSVHGHGTGDLLEAVCACLPENEDGEDEDERIGVAVIGRPNVGKSSLVNHILGEERMIVANEAGTTRDAVDSDVDNRYGKFTFIDTAGLRKRGKVEDGVERYSVLRSLAAVERAKVCVIMIDATEGFTEQDSKVAGFAHEQGKACIIAVNKWDAVEKDDKTMDVQRKKLMNDFSFMSYAPIIFISAKTGQRVDRLFELIKFVDSQNAMRVTTGMLNDLLARATARVQPPSDKGKRLKIYYMTQIATRPPTFVCFCNSKQLFHFSYARYIENQIRETFGLEGRPCASLSASAGKRCSCPYRAGRACRAARRNKGGGRCARR